GARRGLFGCLGDENRRARVVGDASGLEELDLGVHAVALADAVQPGPGVERIGRGLGLPQVDAAGPAVLGVDELLADQPRDVAEARGDGAEMSRAGGQADMRRQLVLDDRGNHGAAPLGRRLLPDGWLIVASRGPEGTDGLGELPGLPPAAAQFTQDAPGFELGVRALAGAAQRR